MPTDRALFGVFTIMKRFSICHSLLVCDPRRGSTCVVHSASKSCGGIHVKIIIFVALAFVAACAGPNARQPGAHAGAEPLSAEEIQSLISDRWMAREDGFAPGVTHRNEEFFCANGAWRGVGPRFPIAGRYTTDGGELCVQQESSQFCRRLLRDEDGAYFTQRIASHPANQPIIRVRIYPPEDDIDCPV